MNTNTLANRLEQDVRELCLPEGRVVSTEGHKVAEAWVARRLAEIGCEAYRGHPLPCRINGAGKTSPTLPASSPAPTVPCPRC